MNRPPCGLRTRLLPLCLCAGLFLSGCSATGVERQTPPPVSPTPAPTATPTPTPAPTPTPTPEPTLPPYDYAQPAPETDPVEDAWFQDAVFVGDSRTDGLRLYGGVKGADFICYKGLTAFEFDNKACIERDGKKVTALEALSEKTYGKVYVMLGLNELGYSTEEFAKGYATLIDQVRQAQPNAVLYFQSVVPVNPQKCQEKKQPYYISNEKVAQFNAEITRLAEEKQVVFLNVADGLTDEDGILPYDSTSDGVHFSKDWYRTWFSYVKNHTVDPERLEVSE